MTRDPHEAPARVKVVIWIFVFGVVFTIALLASCPAKSQVPPDTPVAEEAPRVAASAWCAIRSSDDRESPGCDVGAAISLQRWKKAAWVAAVGTKTIGTGIAWVASEGRNRPTVAVSAGVIATYDEFGIDADSLYPAVGATISFAGRR